MPNGLVSTAARAVDWLKTYALPLWAEAGFAVGPDYFREGLAFSGEPLAGVPVRSRVQGRQMYAFGHATVLGWFDGRELLSRAFQRGYGWFLDPDGGYVASIAADGTPLDRTRFAYEQAFALLGFAWHERVFRSGEAARRAETLWAWLEDRLGSPGTGGFLMGLPLPEEPRSQNPHMHLFEACLNWHEATGEAVWLDRARALHTLFDRSFFDRENGCLREFFADDLTPTAPESTRIDTGHQAEWIWLLAWYEELTGEPVGEAIAALHRFMERGRNPATGLLYEEIDISGAPLITSSRLWSATELLKQELARHEIAGRSAPTDGIVAIVDRIFDVHLGHVRPGLWMDRVDATGAPLAASVPASTFYHLFLAFAELHRVASRR